MKSTREREHTRGKQRAGGAKEKRTAGQAERNVRGGQSEAECVFPEKYRSKNQRVRAGKGGVLPSYS